MSVFYRPTGKWPAVLELWCRCDICAWSGAHSSFETFVLEGLPDSHICDDCWREDSVQVAMELGGWVKL